MVLLICLTLSSSNCFSALSIISLPLWVGMFLFNFKLTGVIFWLIHLKVNLLWFLKSASFLTWCSQSRNMATLSLPNSFSNILCRFLILFLLIYNMTLRSLFSINRTNISLGTSFCQGHLPWLFQVWGKMLPPTHSWNCVGKCCYS